MKISYWPNNIAMNATEPYNAVLQSMKRTDDLVKEDMDADAAVIWSVLWNGRMQRNQVIWDHYRSQNKPVIVVEVGALNRNITWKLSANGINKDAVWPDCHDAERNKKLGISLKPEHDGDKVLICLQHTKSEQWKEMPPMREWVEQQVKLIQSVTDKPIFIRPHPRQHIDLSGIDGVEIQTPKTTVGDDTDFEEQLKDVHLVVCHTSNPGVQAVINGVRVRCADNSLAWDASIKEFKNINKTMPDREEWFQKLLHTEWTVGELKTGIPWVRLRSKLK